MDGSFEIFRFNAGLGRCLDFENRAQQLALVVDLDVLGNLFFVNQRLIQAAGFAAAQ